MFGLRLKCIATLGPKHVRAIRVSYKAEMGKMLHQQTPILETGIGGVKSPKIRGGGENFEFSGVPKFDPFLQSFF